MARRPGGDQSPRPSLRLQPSPRRTGPAVALDEGCASIACCLVALPSPASRPSTPRRPPSRNPAPASTRPVDARLGPVRPASARRPASVPPSTRPHTPNRRRGALLWSAQPGSDPFGRRAAACRPPISARSGAIRPSTRPWAVHVAASPGHRQPLKLPGSRLRRPAQGPPAPPPRPPAQFPAGAGTRAHTYARACGVEIFRKKNQRDGEPPAPPPSAQFPVQRGRRDIGSRAGASDFPEAGWRRGGAPGARAGRCARCSIQAWS